MHFLALSLLAVVASPLSSDEGIGDATFPTLGNKGYKATHYALKLQYDPDSNLLQADVTMDALSSDALAKISLDFAGFKVDSVTLNGAAVQFDRSANKLRITPSTSIPAGTKFQTEIIYEGKPKQAATASLPLGLTAGWLSYAGGSAAVCEPDLAHTWFPCNDHPLNKATFDLEVTVPESYRPISNGLGSTVDGKTYHFVESKPVMTSMMTLVVGRFTFKTQTGPNNLPITHYMPAELTSEVGAAQNIVPRFIKYFSEHLGPYPFESYGTITLPTAVGEVAPFMRSTAIETTSIPIFGPEAAGDEGTMVHELSHQWFGDDVSVTNWGDDIWWVEGFAQFTEWLAVEELRGKEPYQKQVSAVAAQYATKGKWLKPGHLTAAQMFTERSYAGGALLFAALRKKLGDEKFFAVLKQFVAQHAYGNASAHDWVEISSKVAGSDMKPFFDAWLYGDTEPAI